jgi:Ser/Thr protein kinase RdoA (MazF antagonist)
MLGPANLQPVLEHYRLPDSPLPAQQPQAHRGFSGATVYCIATPRGKFALRDWGPQCPPLKRLRGLHRLLNWIERDGVHIVAVPLDAENGSTIVVQDGAVWQLEPWLPGVADFHANPSRDRLRNVMRAVADWHRAARRFEPTTDEREWFRSDPADASPAARERLQRILKWQRGRLLRLRQALDSDPGDLTNPWDLAGLGQFLIECFEAASPAVAAELQAVAEWRVELQPCLRDVWHDHVLFSGDDVTGLIDASACRCENVASDLSRLLGSFVADDRPAWEFAVECYSRHRELRAAELRLLPILDRSSVLLSGLTWLDRYYLQRRAFPDQEAVFRRMEQIAQRLSHLAGRPLPAQSQ